VVLVYRFLGVVDAVQFYYFFFIFLLFYAVYLRGHVVCREDVACLRRGSKVKWTE
jgi:hypothetical protein